jgi:hypothetical protein
MEEVSPQTQAELELQLSNSVRDLVRKHIHEAFNDYGFMSTLPIDYLHPKLESRSYGGKNFAQSVRDVIKAQMEY